MIIVFKKALAEALGLKRLATFGISFDSWKHSTEEDLHLSRLTPSELDRLEELLTEHRQVRGAGVLLRDLAQWKVALQQPAAAKARTVQQFKTLLVQYLRSVPGHRVYLRESEDVSLPYFVSEIDYYPSVVHHGEREPERVKVTLNYEEFRGKKEKKIWFFEEHCRGRSVTAALARHELYAETPELRTRHQAELALYQEHVPRIGAQFWARGVGGTDVDGNGNVGRWRQSTLQMVRDGQETRVVVDVFFEEADSDRKRSESYVNNWLWYDADQDHETEQEAPEVPVHPYLAIFDMSKHLRLRIHVNYLTPYVYDAGLAEKLVLPAQMKALVQMLVERKSGGFQDIVRGKTGGAVVLLTGPPGVGKTLTAEVYAESEGRALYSVQCSQLGTDPEELEDALTKTFSRATRWKAVLLLDEADVYVHERGRDLQQNAIVGVFLRVLEYQDTVLFLTTNRPDDVDDAIASRCVARLSYPRPTVDEQRRIWRILADAARARLDDATIAAIVTEHRDLSGRDIKNLLKLSMLMQPEGPIEPKTVAFVRQFQPTRQATRDGVTFQVKPPKPLPDYLPVGTRAGEDSVSLTAPTLRQQKGRPVYFAQWDGAAGEGFYPPEDIDWAALRIAHPHAPYWEDQ